MPSSDVKYSVGRRLAGRFVARDCSGEMRKSEEEANFRVLVPARPTEYCIRDSGDLLVSFEQHSLITFLPALCAATRSATIYVTYLPRDLCMNMSSMANDFPVSVSPSWTSFN